ncbi:hypothetical protein HWQ46_26035 [Shewanella sp. D64]|uniref:hypothetical protein n=1 Tax=unclassified Shewanella TaxID=196818 RepID=UPI0022BA4F88|nr:MULTISPECIES: hypothetical protein [unclassified Shewanella]MEC4728976.1 hypothetical protein [Shewanella sp. D64]MEC4740820.1 hypothetical protein [Shewanella sp. E94]WBJ94784.1 hypothetical protein HWQ47_23505 [Shewanella sp. MTB7]
MSVEIFKNYEVGDFVKANGNETVMTIVRATCPFLGAPSGAVLAMYVCEWSDGEDKKEGFFSDSDLIRA